MEIKTTDFMGGKVFYCLGMKYGPYIRIDLIDVTFDGFLWWKVSTGGDHTLIDDPSLRDYFDTWCKENEFGNEYRRVASFATSCILQSKLERPVAVFEDFSISYLDDLPYVSWDNLRITMEQKQYRRFVYWIGGQTTLENGVYPWDLERFLLDLPIID